MNLHRILLGCFKISRRLLGGCKMEKLGLPEMKILRLSLVAESLIYHFVNADKNRLLVFLLRFGNGYLGFDTFDGRIECRF